MKRQRESTHCVALRTHESRTGRPVREFRCYPAAEAELLGRRQLGDLMDRYDTEDECEAACGTLTMLPPEVSERVLGAVPLGALSALARVSRGVRERVLFDVREERLSLATLRDEHPLFAAGLFDVTEEEQEEEEEPTPRVRSTQQLCAEFALPCVRPYGELLARLRHELRVPLLPDRAQDIGPEQFGGTTYARVRYAYCGNDPAAFAGNASFLARGVPAASLPAGWLERVALLPGETVRPVGAGGGASAQPAAFDPYEFTVAGGFAASGLFAVQGELTPTITMPTATGDPFWSVVATYAVPLPPDVPWGELARDGRVLRGYLTAVEALFGLPDGDVTTTVSPDGRQYSLRGGTASRMRIVDTLRRTGLPVSVLYVTHYTPMG